MIKSGDNNLRNSTLYQRVEFTGQEDQNSVGIYSRDVTVVPSSGGHNQGSSKIILKNVVDFTWEHRYYSGQLLAIHMSGKYLAYGIKIPGNTGPAVRVVNKQTEQRKLLKGMKVAIQDLAFAHISSVVLACVDYTGSVYVHTIEDSPSGITCTKILQLDVDECSPTNHRVIWCSYIPDDDQCPDNEDVSKLLIVTRGSKAELWSVNAAVRHLPNNVIKVNDPKVHEACLMTEINQHTGTIVDAAISPDGTALATASADGEVKFFQVSSVLQKQSRCIHQWKPHEGRPISSLFFLDDLKACQPEEQFWRFAITGCDNNTELKVWSCEMWECLQTIKFSPSSTSSKAPVLKASLDLSSRYLILSDIYNKILYILSLTKSKEDFVAYVDTISEFLLPYPILSFAVIDAGRRKVTPAGEFLDDLCSGEDENEDDEQLVIKMYLVQPKSLQECNITFRPALHVARSCLSNSNDRLEDILQLNHNGLSPENGNPDHTTEPNHSAGLNLMTPDAFSSPAKKDGSNNMDSQDSPDLAADTTLDAEPAMEIVAMEEQAPPSGGSSPSREVREILSLAQPEDIETETKIESATKQTNQEFIVTRSDIPYVYMYDGKDEITDTDGAAKVDQNVVREQASTTNVNVESKLTIINDNIFTLRNKIDSLCQTIQEQRQELGNLRMEMSRMSQEMPNMSQVENTVARVLEQENYNQMTRQRELVGTMENAVQEKIEHTVPRVIEGITEPFKHQLRLDVARIDELMRDNLAKIMNSAHVRDSVAHSAGAAVKVALDAAFKEAFTMNLLPALEKTCESMFRQIEESFVRGTKQYLQNTDGLIEKRCQKRNEAQQELITSVIRKEMQNELSKGLSVIQECTVRTVRDSVRDNFTQHMSDMTGIRSRATTPAISVTSSADTQSRILALLQRGQLTAAFQQALSASDLDLVVMVCEKTDPANVFSCPGPDGSRCILPQPVILSLVQQLSADFTDRPQLKHKWLEEAILNLDPSDPVTHEHMANVLMPMQSKLAAFLIANPNHKYARRMKVLAMAARALLTHQHP